MSSTSDKLVLAVEQIAKNGAAFVKKASMDSDYNMAKELIASSDPEEQALGKRLRLSLAKRTISYYDNLDDSKGGHKVIKKPVVEKDDSDDSLLNMKTPEFVNMLNDDDESIEQVEL